MLVIECPVCGSSKYKVLFNDHNRRDQLKIEGTYVRCANCSLIYLRERPKWDDIVSFYSSQDVDQVVSAGNIDIPNICRKKTIPLWKRLLRKFRFRPHSWPLDPVPQDSKRILDLGCGSGVKLIEFAERGYEVWGVDVGTDSIQTCKKILQEGKFIQGELQQTNLPSEHFHYIRIDNCLEHVPNPKEVVGECFRLLKPGGSFFIYVPHGNSLSMRFMKRFSVSSWIPFHLQLFTKHSVTKLLTDAGYSNIEIMGYYPLSWLPLSLMQRWYKENVFLKKYPIWLNAICYPVGWLSIKLGLAEELVVIAKKYRAFNTLI